jgi:acyl dehydratase
MVGEQIPILETSPVSRLRLALFAGASGDHDPIHVDLDFARAAGFDDVFAHGMLSMAYLGRMLTNWIPQSALREFRVRFTAITHVHDRVICTGRIVETFERAGERMARVELQAATQRGEVTVTGEAIVAVDLKQESRASA